jgi:hypothetical protein
LGLLYNCFPVVSRQKLVHEEKLVSLNCEVTAETKQEMISLASGLDDGLSFGRTIQWLLRERERLGRAFTGSVDLLHDNVRSQTALNQHKQSEDERRRVPVAPSIRRKTPAVKR